MDSIKVNVYGADAVCASCVNAPTSKDIYDWIQPNLKRKFEQLSFTFNYIDIADGEGLSDYDQSLLEQIENDELFYPLVTMNDDIVADGYIQLPQLTKYIDRTFIK
ncbi:DUF1462 family protein [Macrococcus equipercicus]|uniref:DUF1462 family protein n=1 Tax=Macrococcus equipercicus TaxID=69967 RepID=A0ABQ6RBC9_9STAP|nr:DUF1462 family protein [Macrococcus equipercicus]KAA1042542.1 DUF1462 family protein [Macrococcus equipercicus]